MNQQCSIVPLGHGNEIEDAQQIIIEACISWIEHIFVVLVLVVVVGFVVVNTVVHMILGGTNGIGGVSGVVACGGVGVD